MGGFDFRRLLGSGLDRADEATLGEAAAELRRRIAAGENDLSGFLQQVEDRYNWKRNQRLDAEHFGRRSDRHG